MSSAAEEMVIPQKCSVPVFAAPRPLARFLSVKKAMLRTPYSHITVKAVSRSDPMIIIQPIRSAVFNSNPRPVSQIKWRNPPSMWYQSAQRDRRNTRSPNQLVITHCTHSKAAALVDAAKSQAINNSVAAKSALPVIRTNIEEIEVI
jgi:hypothetical protein